MTRAHRPAGGDSEDHRGAYAASAPPVRPERRWPRADDSGIGDAGSLTLSELITAADARQVDPSSLLDGPAQADVHEALELAARLPDPAAALAIDFARLDPAAAAVLARMIERYVAAERRR